MSEGAPEEPPEREPTLPPPEEAPWAKRAEEANTAAPALGPLPAPPLGERVRRLVQPDALAHLAARALLPVVVLFVGAGASALDSVASGTPLALLLALPVLIELDLQERRWSCERLYGLTLGLGSLAAAACFLQCVALYALLGKGDPMGGVKVLGEVLESGPRGLRALAGASMLLALPLAASVGLRARHLELKDRVRFVVPSGVLVGVILAFVFPGMASTGRGFDPTRYLSFGLSLGFGSLATGVLLAGWARIVDALVARLVRARPAPDTQEWEQQPLPRRPPLGRGDRVQ